jgi:hypothetical protein
MQDEGMQLGIAGQLRIMNMGQDSPDRSSNWGQREDSIYSLG